MPDTHLVQSTLKGDSRLVYELYCLTPDEIAVVEEANHLKGEA